MREAIRIGETAVKPGERAAFDLPIVDLSTNTHMTMPVQVAHGREEGPRLFISAAVHGDELNGIEVIRRLMGEPALAEMAGTLIAVPIVNVFGFVGQSRYLPDRRDLNRTFPGSAKGSLAGRLAHLFLREIVANATHGIDLHTGAVHRSNHPQVRANLKDRETARLATAFGAPVVINSGFREGSLRESAAKRSVPVLVYEAGEALRLDEDCIRVGLRGCLNVMRALDMLPAGESANAPPLIANSSSWSRAPMSGVLREGVALGAEVKKGDTLGIVGAPFGEAMARIKTKSDGVVIGRTYLPVVYEGDALFHVVAREGEGVAANELDVPLSEEEEEWREQDEALTYG